MWCFLGKKKEFKRAAMGTGTFRAAVVHPGVDSCFKYNK